MEHKKYLHELTDEEFKGITFEEGNKFSKPEWCKEPDPINPFGCWALIRMNGLKKDWSDKCKHCPESINFIGFKEEV